MKKLIFLSFLFFACNNTTTPPTALPGTSPEARLKTLGIQLPEVPQPVANYVSAVQTGNLIFLSGTGPRQSDGTYIVGKLGDDLTLRARIRCSPTNGNQSPGNFKSYLGGFKSCETCG